MNLDKLQSHIKASDAAYLVVSPENRAYFTDFESSDGMLAVTRDKALFLTDSRYTEAASQAITCCPTHDCGNYFDALNEFFSDNGVRRIFIEAGRLPVAEFSRIKAGLAAFSLCAGSALDDAIWSVRRTKSGQEINSILAAQRVAEAALEHIFGFIREGVTEREIGLELDNYMLSHGAQALSFQTIAVAGENSSKPHGVPGDRHVCNGDFITMDFGAVVNGRHSDMTRTVVLGRPDEEQKAVYDIVLRAQRAGLEVLRAGLPCAKADGVVRDLIGDAGYGKCFGHGTGHGVGAEIHERPLLNTRTREVLMEGDVVTVEPGIYLPGKFGVRIEDMAFITSNGSIDLTTAPKQLICL